MTDEQPASGKPPDPRRRRRFVAACLLATILLAATASLVLVARPRDPSSSAPPAVSPAVSPAEPAPAAPAASVPQVMTAGSAAPAPAPPAPNAPSTAERAPCPAEPPLLAPAAPLDPGGLPQEKDLARLLRDDPRLLGSASIGTPTRGSLFGGVALAASDAILLAGDHPWGTASVIASIERAAREVRRCFPTTPALYVGDISRERGGWLSPHRSHQSGLDADIGYFYRTGPTWYVPATAQTLDGERTWALVRALLEGGNVEYVFMDVRVQRLLAAHAATLPRDRELARGLFEAQPGAEPVVRHVSGHQGHFHVRFRDPVAVGLGAKIRHLVAPAAPPRSSKPTRKPAAARSR